MFTNHDSKPFAFSALRRLLLLPEIHVPAASRMSVHPVVSIPAPPSTSSSGPVVEQWISLKNDRYVSHHGHSNQDQLRYTAQSFLECLDRYNHPGRLVSAYKGIINICLEEILANCSQSEVVNEGPWKYGNIDEHATSGIRHQTPVRSNEVIYLSLADLPLVSQPSALQHLQAEPPGQENGLLSRKSRGVTTLPEETNPPIDQLLPDLFPSGFVSYEQGAKPFHSFVPRDVTYSEAKGQTLPGPSTSRHQDSHLPITPGVQEKVKCTWAGCSSVVRKDGYTRHLNETHRRKVKAVCAHCERPFPRMYMKNNHELTCRGQPSKSRHF